MIIDEVGCLSTHVAPTFVPNLVQFTTSRSHRVRVIACLPVHARGDSIQSFLKTRGVENSKYRRVWHRVEIPFLDRAGIDHIFAFLPPRARALACEHVDVVIRRSRCRPVAVQRACSALYKAEKKGASRVDLELIIDAEGSYE